MVIAAFVANLNSSGNKRFIPLASGDVPRDTLLGEIVSLGYIFDPINVMS